jgi:hypothetical protein
MDDLKNFCCQNPDCKDYAQRGLENLRVSFRYGRAKQHRMLVCRTCQHRFSERKGTPCSVVSCPPTRPSPSGNTCKRIVAYGKPVVSWGSN